MEDMVHWFEVVGLSAFLIGAVGCSGTPSDGPTDAGAGSDVAADARDAATPTSVAVNALVPSLEAPSGGCGASSAGNAYCDFFKYVAPNVSGVSVFLDWAQIDHGAAPCVEGSSTNGCDWTAFDATLDAYVHAGLFVNLIVIAVNEGGTTNIATPSYVFTPAYASTLNAAPQDMATCGLWQGGPNSPVHGSSTVGGVWNHDDCYATNGACTGAAPYSDTNGFPIVYEKPFMTAYEGFIANVFKHYSSAGTGDGPTLAAKIGYARFGLTAGGEAQLYCSDVWPGVAGLSASPLAYSKSLFVGSKDAPTSGYVSSIIGFIHDQHGAFSSLINSHSGPPADTDVSYADDEANIALANGVGFGMEALSIGDAYQHSIGSPCNDDWCTNFESAASSGVPLVLQSTVPTTAPTYEITSISGDGTAATVTCATNCDLYTGNSAWVSISGSSEPSFNGAFLVRSVTSANSFAFASSTKATGTGGTLENPDYLPVTVPFGVSEHATAFEIYLCDLLYAFDPNAVVAERCSTPPGATSSLYASTLLAARGQ
jgi:hypothetical protein